MSVFWTRNKSKVDAKIITGLKAKLKEREDVGGQELSG